MSKNYFIGIVPQTDDYHSIHKEDCPFLPDHRNRIYLGMFKSPSEAQNEGLKHFNRSNRCLFCSKEHHSNEKKPYYKDIPVVKDFLSLDSVVVSWDSPLRYCIN
jgi:hypothetical protein